jgi:glycosyltransferase involved in cell wall biosynthesis
MRVLMIVQLVDEQDWLRGFIVAWIRSLAARVDHLHVLTLEERRASLPDNVSVYSMGKEHGHNRLRELAAFHQTLSRIVPEVDVIFSHMTPRYTWLAAPYAALFRKPQILWFVHRQVSWELRLAHRAAARIATASPESFSLPSSKVTLLGHGIDLAHFYPASEPAPRPSVLSVGRLSPIKNHEILIQAIAHLRDQGCRELQVAIAGGETPENPGYAKHLRDIVRSLRLENQVRLLGAVPYRDIPTLYREAALTVNLCPTGGMDKAALESMACGVPALVHNETFLPLLESYESVLWCQHLDPQRVAAQLQGLLSQSPRWRAEVGSQLRQRIKAGYSLDVLTERLVDLFAEITP